MELHTIRVRDGKKLWWIVFDKTNTMNGRVNEPLTLLKARWEVAHGRPSKIVSHTEQHSPAEAAATIADHQGA